MRSMRSFSIMWVLFAVVLPLFLVHATPSLRSSPEPPDRLPRVTITRISAIQGSGASTTMEGQTVTIEGIVVGDFQNGDADTLRNLGGFFVQEEDADRDDNAATSEGIFVYEGSRNFIMDVNVGDLVQVTGTIGEFFGETQLGAVTSIRVLSFGNTLPTAAQITLPTNRIVNGQPDLERYEGMLVEFPQTLTIVEQSRLDRFNEIKLVQGGRPFQFTQTHSPNATEYASYLRSVRTRAIIYDDGRNVQNARIGGLDGFGPTYTTANAKRMGDTITGLTGILSYQWAGNSASQTTWRVRSIVDGSNTFVSANPRSFRPASVGGTLKVSTLNVLNFFTTLDIGNQRTALGQDPRGADNQAEYNRQLEKLATTIRNIDADILGLIELENDFPLVPQTLADAVNIAVGSNTYEVLNPGLRFVGSDAIAVGFLYKPSTVYMTGSPATLTDSDLAALPVDVATPVFNGPGTSRVPLAATFLETSTGACVTVSANHFRSKGSACPGDGARPNDGAGNCNTRRNDAAKAVVAWLDTNPTGFACENKIIVGDLNAYAKEDPIVTLEASGYVDIARQFDAAAYSFTFDGRIGTLDYVFVNNALLSRVTGAVEWHINADEANAIDYNTGSGRDNSIFDGTVPYRASDHDPLLVGLTLGAMTRPSMVPSQSFTPSLSPTLSKMPSTSPTISNVPSSILTPLATPLAIVLYNADNPDEFAFVALTTLATGFAVLFTDNGVNTDGTFRDNEGTIRWQATSSVARGTVVTITPVTQSANVGTVAIVGGSFALSTAGDQLTAYQVDASNSNPTFLFAFQNQGSAFGTTDTTTSNDSALPPGLVLGTTAVAIREVDNAVYTGSTIGTPDEILGWICNSKNWSGSNNVRQTAPTSFSLY